MKVRDGARSQTPESRHPQPGRGGFGRAVAASLSVLLLASGLAAVTASTAAADQASNNGLWVDEPVTFYAYTRAGETLDVNLTPLNIKLIQPGYEGPSTSPTVMKSFHVEVLAPDGSSHGCDLPVGTPISASTNDPTPVPGQLVCNWDDLTSGAPGVWRIAVTRGSEAGSGTYASWEVTAKDGGTAVPGRVWTDRYAMVQYGRGAGTPNPANGEPRPAALDFSLWYLGENGYQYRADYQNYNGYGSEMISDAFGVTTSPTSCEPAYRSTGNRGADLAKAATEYGTSNGRCGPAYHIFFTTPAADLPAAAQLGNGQTIYVNPAIQTPTITSLEWEPAAEGSYGGTFTGELTRIGGVPADVGMDVDEDGTPDIIVTGAIDGDGHFTASWDGRDDDGNLVPIGNTVTASLTISRMGEIHFLRADVERSGGIRVRRLNGQDPGWVALQWDDSQLAGGLSGTDEGANRACSTPAVTGPGAADGSFVHGWYTGPCGDGYPWGGGPNSPSLNSNNGTDGGWGDARQIADWTYEEFQAAPYTIRLGELPTIEVIKNVRSRVAGSSDQFTVGVSTSTGTEVTSVSTAGTASAATTGPQGVLPDRTYTVFENTTSGSNPLTGYTASLACVDRTGATVPTSGTAGDWTLRTPDGPVFSGPGDPPIVAADITCTITNVAKDAPAAAPDSVVVEQGATATLDPVVTPGSGAITAVAFDNGGTSKVVPGEGSWEIELTAGGAVVASFTPETGFTGPVTQQPYTVTDQNGLTAGSTLDVVIQPAAGDASATIRPGETATLEPIVTLGSGAITRVAFDNGETTKQVPGEGSWTIELTGDGDVVARFTPEDGYTGPVTPQPYTVTDQNGLTATGTLEVVIAHAGLLLEKDYAAVSDANGNGISDAGDVVRWTFTVTNTGTLTLEDVRVDDPLLVDLGIAIDCEQTTLAPGATTSCESDEYTITQADVRAGSIRNVATATAEVPPGTPGDPENPVSPPAEVELPTAPDPSLPVTGAQVGLAVTLATVLLLAGGGLLLASRRRRDPEASE